MNSLGSIANESNIQNKLTKHNKEESLFISKIPVEVIEGVFAYLDQKNVTSVCKDFYDIKLHQLKDEETKKIENFINFLIGKFKENKKESLSKSLIFKNKNNLIDCENFPELKKLCMNEKEALVNFLKDLKDINIGSFIDSASLNRIPEIELHKSLKNGPERGFIFALRVIMKALEMKKLENIENQDKRVAFLASISAMVGEFKQA